VLIVAVGIPIEHGAHQPLWSRRRGLLGAQRRQVVVNDFSIAALGKGLTIGNDGFRRSLQTIERARAAKPRFGKIGRPGKGGKCIVIALGLVEYLAEAEPRFGTVRLERHGSLEATHRGPQVAPFKEHGSKVGMRFGVIGLQGDRALVAHRGILRSILLPQDISEAVVRL